MHPIITEVLEYGRENKKALLISPLAAPFLFSLSTFLDSNCPKPFLVFPIVLCIGCVCSYAMTIFAFAPAIWGLSRFVTLRYYIVCLVGAALGVMVFAPASYQAFLASGVNSGPPEGSYFSYLWASWDEVITWTFPTAGIITASIYWYFARDAYYENLEEHEHGEES